MVYIVTLIAHKQSYGDMKKRLYEILERSSPHDIPGRTVDIIIISLIFLNILAVILETVPSIDRQYGELLRLFELISVVVFSVEYLLRLWACTSDARFRHPVSGRLKFILSPIALIDLLAIAPFYLPMIVPVDPDSSGRSDFFDFSSWFGIPHPCRRSLTSCANQKESCSSRCSHCLCCW